MNVNAVIMTLCKTPYPPKVCIAFCTSDDYSRLPEWREVREDRQYGESCAKCRYERSSSDAGLVLPGGILGLPP